MRRSVRPLHALVAALTLFSLGTVAACKGDASEQKAEGEAKAGEQKADAKGDVEADPSAGEAGQPAAGSGTDKPTGDAPADAGEPTPAAEAGEVAPADAGDQPPGDGAEVDAIPGLLEQAKSLDSDDATATKALNDAVTAGAAKLDVAKVANARGEALLTKGEGERAEPFFVWARDAHSLFAEPVYNLAKMAAYAGDLDIAKEHLQELEKRGNKKLMKKVGVEPAFAPLHDDPDVRKIFEQ